MQANEEAWKGLVEFWDNDGYGSDPWGSRELSFKEDNATAQGGNSRTYLAQKMPQKSPQNGPETCYKDTYYELPKSDQKLSQHIPQKLPIQCYLAGIRPVEPKPNQT